MGFCLHWNHKDGGQSRMRYQGTACLAPHPGHVINSKFRRNSLMQIQLQDFDPVIQPGFGCQRLVSIVCHNKLTITTKGHRGDHLMHIPCISMGLRQDTFPLNIVPKVTLTYTEANKFCLQQTLNTPQDFAFHKRYVLYTCNISISNTFNFQTDCINELRFFFWVGGMQTAIFSSPKLDIFGFKKKNQQP